MMVQNVIQLRSTAPNIVSIINNITTTNKRLIYHNHNHFNNVRKESSLPPFCVANNNRICFSFQAFVQSCVMVMEGIRRANVNVNQGGKALNVASNHQNVKFLIVMVMVNVSKDSVFVWPVSKVMLAKVLIVLILTVVDMEPVSMDNVLVRWAGKELIVHK